MNDCKEAITIPDGCYATIEGNKVVFRKLAYPIPRALEVAALHLRMNNCPSSPDTIGAFVAGAEWQKQQFRKIEKLGTEEREKTKLKAKTEEQMEHISLVILGDVTTIGCDESVIYIDDFISYGQMAEIVDYLRKEEQQ